MTVGEVILLEIKARRMECPRCRNNWLYTGKSEHFVSCSKCRTTITINPKHKKGGVEG
jgi:ribosomal protein S27E